MRRVTNIFLVNLVESISNIAHILRKCSIKAPHNCKTDFYSTFNVIRNHLASFAFLKLEYQKTSTYINCIKISFTHIIIFSTTTRIWSSVRHLGQLRRKGYTEFVMESDIENYEVIPMKPCRSRSLPFNQFRQIPEVEKPRKSSAHPTFATSPNSHNSFKVRFFSCTEGLNFFFFKSEPKKI